MTDHSHFLRAIIASPDDDAPRLVYADWLEENGEPERSEFIRVQIELAIQCSRCEGWGGYTNPDGSTSECWRCKENKPRRDALRNRERDIFPEMAMETFERMPKAISGLTFSWGHGHVRNGRYDFEFRRGFIESISLSCADFMQHAKTIFAVAPIREVRLTDKFPEQWTHQGGVVYSWYCIGFADDRATIPEKLFERLIGGQGGRAVYATSEQAAIDALSAACVAYGRGVASNPKFGVKPAVLWR